MAVVTTQGWGQNAGQQLHFRDRQGSSQAGRRVRTRDAQNSQGQRWAPLGEPASTVEMIITHMTPRATWEQ